MGFIQIVEFSTDKHEEVKALQARFLEATEGKRTTARVTVTSDRDNPSRYMVIAEFPSYEAAMENSNLAETDAMASEMANLVDGPPTFHNLNVLERILEG
ncbi:MAG: hypothetical protein AB1673_07180 [Actinomycetota bacterium]|jgi:quinol monooxygenase YgiN